MTDGDRYKLLGTYRTPRFKYGTVVTCAIRGPVKVVGMTDARIPWPKCRSGKRARAIILYGDLARAVRKESSKAVSYWFGVGMFTVWKWRKALGVDRVNEGTSALFSRNAPETVQSEKAIDNLVDALKSPERAAKIAASKRGKPRPAHVHEALKAANVGRVPSDDARANMSAAQKRRGVRPPAVKGLAWTADEDALLGTMPDADITERIGRTLSAVQSRRYLLGVGAFIGH
jgi:hypothetical protein